MIIEIAKVSPQGTDYAGEDSPELLDLEKDHFVHGQEPIVYELHAERVGDELIVKGSFSTVLSLKCVKCGEFFSTTIGVSSFLRAYEISGHTENIDVGADMREDILLALPNYPACGMSGSSANPACEQKQRDGYAVDPPMPDGRWNELDRFNSGGN